MIDGPDEVYVITDIKITTVPNLHKHSDGACTATYVKALPPLFPSEEVVAVDMGLLEAASSTIKTETVVLPLRAVIKSAGDSPYYIGITPEVEKLLQLPFTAMYNTIKDQELRIHDLYARVDAERKYAKQLSESVLEINNDYCQLDNAVNYATFWTRLKYLFTKSSTVLLKGYKNV